MKLFENKINNIPIINFSKNEIVDSEKSEEFKNKLHTYLLENDYKMILDCGNLTFLDSSGISAILSAFKIAMLHDGYIRLTKLTDTISELFEIIKLNKIFPIYKTIDEALKTT